MPQKAQNQADNAVVTTARLKAAKRSAAGSGSRQAGKNNRDRITDAAWELFWLNGYHATSVADIAKLAGLPKGSIYNYFESKDALLVQVLGRLKYQTETELRLKVLQGTLPPSDLVVRLLDHYIDLYGKLGFCRGDPLGGRMAELADTHPALMSSLRPLQQAWLTVVIQKIWAYATVSRIPALVDKAEPLASVIWAAVQGALIQMKVAHSAEPLEEAKRTLAPMIASYVAALASGDVPE
jgi:TetR/AcrR family transcriptional regulator, transcriptional repressor for nem operon